MFFSTFFKVLPQHETLRTIALMRIVALACLLLVLTFATFVLHITLRLTPLLGVMAALLAFNAWTWWRMQQSQPISEPAVFAQLLVDISALSVMLYFSGGATNPFVSFYLPALAVAASVLSWPYALLLSCLAITAYSVLTTFFVQLQIGDPYRAISYHLAGMWANFAVSATLITWFVVSLSRTVRQRDAQLAQAQLRYLETDRLAALGIQAANIAHEIGTPLSTVAIIAGELRHDLERAQRSPTNPPHPLNAYSDEIVTVEAQLALCVAALDRLGKRDHDSKNDKPVTAATWLAQFADAWRLRYPAVRIDVDLAEGDTKIHHTASIAQILTTMLDNAAQASTGTDAPLSLRLRTTSDSANIDVLNKGSIIAPELLKRLGFEPINTQTGGRGIGLFLAFATARQIGAKIALTSSERDGTCATLRVPLA
jgi:two-component system, sensor histidine kinase RegB